MTIRKGADWGAVGSVPDGLLVVRSNAELFAALNGAAPVEAVGLRGGDLAKTAGVAPESAPLEAGAGAITATVDVVVVEHDHGTHRFAAHAVARRSWWRGTIVGVMNAQFIGAWDVAPRSHPNDGRVDVLEVAARMGLRQRRAAARRLPTASHVPHPLIAASRVTEKAWTFRRPLGLWLDGVRVGSTKALRVSVLADALRVWI